jgi:putative Holliday junction resolvase
VPVLPDIAALPAALREPPGALFGLDLGAKTLGVAVCDVRRTLVSPLTVIRRTKFTQDAAALLRLASEHAVTGLVLGLPLNMDGSEGPRAQSARSFARNLAALTALPIALFDERLSTFEANDILERRGVPTARRPALIDAAAAAVILEGALGRLRPA